MWRGKKSTETTREDLPSCSDEEFCRALGFTGEVEKTLCGALRRGAAENFRMKPEEVLVSSSIKVLSARSPWYYDGWDSDPYLMEIQGTLEIDFPDDKIRLLYPSKNMKTFGDWARAMVEGLMPEMDYYLKYSLSNLPRLKEEFDRTADMETRARRDVFSRNLHVYRRRTRKLGWVGLIVPVCVWYAVKAGLPDGSVIWSGLAGMIGGGVVWLTVSAIFCAVSRRIMNLYCPCCDRELTGTLASRAAEAGWCYSCDRALFVTMDTRG